MRGVGRLTALFSVMFYRLVRVFQSFGVDFRAAFAGDGTLSCPLKSFRSVYNRLEAFKGGLLVADNPFTPSFGERPLYFAGRRKVIDDMARAFESARRRPDLTTILTGARGTGKTALLSLISSEAEQRGWIAVSTTSLPGMLEDIEIGLAREAAHLLESPSSLRISSIGIPQLIDVELGRASELPSSWRYRMSDLIERLNEQGVGVLITVDEVDPGLDEMVKLAAVYQHFVREDRKVSLVMAGLPGNVSRLLGDKTVSFLRRARMVSLGVIPDSEIIDALRKTLNEGGKRASAEALMHAAQAIGGFPFMMQLVGYQAWEADPSSDELTTSDFEYGKELARDEIRERIFEATCRDLSEGDLRFARAMLEDEGESKVSDIATGLAGRCRRPRNIVAGSWTRASSEANVRDSLRLIAVFQRVSC